MPDKLTSEEKQLIAEAIAGGRLTICPPFKYSPEPEDISWHAQRAASYKARGRRFGNVKNAEKGETTRETVIAEARAGKRKYEEIAKKLNLSVSYVGAIIRKARKDGDLQ